MRLYRRDFEAAGGPLAFTLRHLPAAVAVRLREGADSLPLRYAKFDWTLVGPTESP